MPFYKVPTKALQTYYSKNISDNDLLPLSIIPSEEFNFLSDIINKENDFEKIQEYSAKNLKRLSDSLDDKFLLQGLKKDNIDKPKNTKELVELIISKKIRNHYLDSSIKSYLINYYLPIKSKFENFKSILNMTMMDYQSEIIDISFEKNKDITSIQNIDGLNQIYASFYSKNMKELVIHSSSLPSRIKDILSLEAEPIEANNNDVEVILNNNQSFVNFSYLAHPNEYLNDDKSSASLQNVDLSEQLQNKISNLNQPISNQEFFATFNLILEEISVESYLEPITIQKIDNFKNYLLKLPQDAIEEYYLSTIKSHFKTINTNEASANILKILSPNSSFLGKEISDKISPSIHNTLQQSLTTVENAHLYCSFPKEFFSVHSLNHSTCEFIEINAKKSKAEYQKIINEGQVANIKHFQTIGTYGKNAIESLVQKISQNDSLTLKELQSSEHFSKLQRDIYPLLSFKDKLKYVNYKCFTESLEGNLFTHINTIPFSLWEGKIFENITDTFKTHEDLKCSYGKNEIIENYLIPAFITSINTQLENANSKKELFDMENIVDLFREEQILRRFNDELLKSNERESLVTHLFEHHVLFQKESDIITVIKNLLPSILSSRNIKNLSSEYFETVKDIYFLLPNLFDDNLDKRYSTPLLEFLALSPSFNPSDNETKNMVLKFYMVNNNCIRKDSPQSLAVFFQDLDFLKEVIQYHKKLGIPSYAKAFDIHDGFKADSFSDSLISKTHMKKLIPLGFDLGYLSPTLLEELPSDVLNDAQKWKEILPIYLTTKREHDVIIPKSISQNYEVFDNIFSHYLTLLKSSTNNNVVKQASVIKQFSNILIHRKEQVMKVLEYFRDVQFLSDTSHKNLESALSEINPELHFACLSIQRNMSGKGLNPFAEAINGLNNITMSKQIFRNTSSQSKIKKF